MIKNVKCNGETVTQIVNGSGTKLADLTAEVENEAAYVLPTSTNAGGELTAGSTIAAGTYFSGDASVPSGGGWTPTVSNGTVTGAGSNVVTIEHNLGTKNVAVFVFSSLAMNGGACSAMKHLFSVVFNPETFYKTGYSNTYDCSSFNETVGAVTIDWSAEPLGVTYQTPYTSGAFNAQNKYTTSSSTFTENSVTVASYSTFSSGTTYYWFAFALPDYTESQKLVIGNSEV